MVFLKLQQKYHEGKISEAKYWSAVCKWKKGKTQTAIEELQGIIKSSKDNEIIAQSHLSLADIFSEMNQNNDFLFHLTQITSFQLQ